MENSNLVNGMHFSKRNDVDKKAKLSNNLKQLKSMIVSAKKKLEKCLNNVGCLTSCSKKTVFDSDDKVSEPILSDPDKIKKHQTEIQIRLNKYKRLIQLSNEFDKKNKCKSQPKESDQQILRNR
ncbi:hypothetical protein A3Q56_02401 [Intoshia linei]|uniref:Uncharacterized protein n=1 Tax=Intoshia linei TaxID=1819745 RepID=A0A177B8G3_9BILA|nr:hypothetical protein A3Q56_02401 [Intoshia linei]